MGGAVWTRTTYFKATAKKPQTSKTHHKTRKYFNDYEGLVIASYVKTIISTVEKRRREFRESNPSPSTEY
jgi:hypothetical protein